MGGAYEGHWFSPSPFGPTTLDLSSGKGFWARSKQSTTQTIYIDGLVPETEISVPITVDAANMVIHQIGQPLPADVPLTEADTTFWADGGMGSTSAGGADEIWVWDPDAKQYITAFLFDSDGGVAGGAYDGQWFSPSPFGPITMDLKKGMAWWYRSKADDSPRTGQWQWTEPVPY